MIFLGSRYESSPIVPALAASNNHVTLSVLREAQPIPTENTLNYYFWREGDRIDLVSLRMYGNVRDWWKILDANPEIIDALTITPGTKILIP